MTREEIYLLHKKKGLIEHVKQFNERHQDSCQFRIDEDNLDIEKTFCTPNVCSTCGNCCTSFPCIFAPSDFLDINNLDYMRKLLDTGVICISDTYWNRPLVIRPRGINDGGIVSLLSQRRLYKRNNSCLLQSSEGCILPAVYRPSEGLLYHALTNDRHLVIYSERDIDREYRPYDEVLYTLLCEYADKKSSIDEAKDRGNVRRLTRYMVGYDR